MEREKRQVKLPEAYIIPKACYPRFRKKKPKKKTQPEARYQLIPCPLKVNYSSNCFVLYGDVGLKLSNGTLINETGILNEYLACRGVDIMKEQTYNVVNLTVEKKFKIQLPAWQYIVESLLQSENSELKGWGERIQQYSLQYEEFYRSLSNKHGLINGFNKQEQIKITQETKRKIQKLFSHYPCICFTSTQEKKFNKVKDISFNEQYIQELGYSLETFASIVLQEGLPRMLPTDTACCAKILIDNYYNLGRNGCDTPDIISDLVMKSGQLKKIRFKIYYFPSYTERAYDVSAVFVILERGQTDSQEIYQDLEVNQNFLKKMIQKENEINKFMQKFYNTRLNLPYSSEHKVCRIKELEIVKSELDFEL